MCRLGARRRVPRMSLRLMHLHAHGRQRSDKAAGIGITTSVLACSPMPSKRTVSVFVGGSVGTDRYSPETWSGAAPHWLAAMKEHGLLDAAHGVTVPRALHYATLAKNYNTNRA